MNFNKGADESKIFEQVLGNNYRSEYGIPYIYKSNLCECQVERAGIIEIGLVSINDSDQCLSKALGFHQFLLFRFQNKLTKQFTYLLSSNYQNDNLLQKNNTEANCIGETIIYKSNMKSDANDINSISFESIYKYKSKKKCSGEIKKIKKDSVNLVLKGEMEGDQLVFKTLLDNYDNRISGTKGTGYTLESILGFKLAFKPNSKREQFPH